jgi:transcriptional regulator with XRE-family HTH domain
MTSTMASLYAADYTSPEGFGSVVRSVAGTGGLKRTFAYYVAGTMGLLTPQAVEGGYATSVTRMHYESAARGGQAETEVELERTAAEDLARIRAVLQPTVLELSNLFGVSRQAVYDWQAGAQPSPPVANRLAQFARAADVFDEAGLAVDTKTLRRKVSGGRTLLDVVLSDGDAVSVAQRLVSTLRREADQRQRLEQQLAGRQRGVADPSDYGAPAVSDDV